MQIEEDLNLSFPADILSATLPSPLIPSLAFLFSGRLWCCCHVSRLRTKQAENSAEQRPGRDTSLVSIQGPPPSLLSQTARPPQGVPDAQPASSATLSSPRTGGSQALRGSASFTLAKHHLKLPAFVCCDDVVILKKGMEIVLFFPFSWRFTHKCLPHV